jgi:hypothetical protein
MAGDGTHFMKLYVGSPAQLRVLALNTGMDFSAWPCEVSGMVAGLLIFVFCLFQTLQFILSLLKVLRFLALCMDSSIAIDIEF